MRISDWSSDVCSSDLWPHFRFTSMRASRDQVGGCGKSPFCPEIEPEHLGAVKEIMPAAELRVRREDRGIACAAAVERCKCAHQIGRASVRERGGQYVSFSVVAVALQKKKTTEQ